MSKNRSGIHPKPFIRPQRFPSDGRTRKRLIFACRERALRSFPGVALVGLTGLEPVTLRLSSACSNQLSYRPFCKRPWVKEYRL